MSINSITLKTVTTSTQWRLNLLDGAKALLVAALTTPVSIILTSFSASKFEVDWTTMWHLAVGGAAAYLLKNLGTPAQTVIKGSIDPAAITTVVIPPAAAEPAKATVQTTKP